MLDLLYIAIVALPLTLAAAALLLVSVRSVQSRAEQHVQRHAAQVTAAQDAPPGLRKPGDPLTPAASVATLGDVDIGAIGRTLAAALEPADPRTAPASAPVAPDQISEIAAALSFPPRAPARPVVGAPPGDLADAAASAVAGRATKRCPDCAEEVLAAARVCKHCRYRWEGHGEQPGALTA